MLFVTYQTFVVHSIDETLISLQKSQMTAASPAIQHTLQYNQRNSGRFECLLAAKIIKGNAKERDEHRETIGWSSFVCHRSLSVEN